MRHRHAGRQLSRTSAHRKALLRNLVTSLFEHESVTTTVAKAKEARPVAEHLITLAKRGDLHARRQAASYIRSEDVNKKLFDTIAPWYTERPGGYTRITRVGRRLGDAGEVGILSLVKSAEQVAAEGGSASPETAPKKRRFPQLGWRRKKAAPAAAAAPAGPVHRNSRKEKREANRAAGSKPARGATRRRRSEAARTEAEES